VPVHAIGRAASLGPTGIRDHLPASAGTVVVVEAGTVEVDVVMVDVVVGAADVLETALFPCPPPHPVKTRAANTTEANAPDFTWSTHLDHAGNASRARPHLPSASSSTTGPERRASSST
jgi:hypothetical protein